MLPVVASPTRIGRNVFCYTVALVASTIVFAPVAHMGPTYVVVATVTGAAYLGLAARLWVLARRSAPIEGEAMRLFGYSITYLTAVIGVDGNDPTGDALKFAHESGVTFPVAVDPYYQVTEGLYYFSGDPDAVFINGNGTIEHIVRGPITRSELVTWERRLT